MKGMAMSSQPVVFPLAATLSKDNMFWVENPSTKTSDSYYAK
jgi:hypothetical protein